MDLQSLAYFLTVAEEKNITNAAAKLHMSQPPLSRRMAMLEEKIGTQLLIRSSQGVELTDAGKLLRSRARDLLCMHDKILDEVRGCNESGFEKISLGVVDSISTTLLSDAICGFLKSHPNVNFSLLTEISERICELVDSNVMNVGIVRLDTDRRFYNYIPFQRDTWMAIINPENPLARPETNEISISMFAGQPLILPSKHTGEHELHKHFRNLGIRVRPIVLCNSLSMGILLAEKNAGICLAPSSVLSNIRKLHNVIVKRIINPTIYSTAYLIWEKNNTLSPTMSSFIEYMKDYLENYPVYSYEFT